MFSTIPFDSFPQEYDAWFGKHPHVFESEVNAIKKLMPPGSGLRILEVGLGTGRFSMALGITEGIEPSEALRKIALQRGVSVKDAIAEKLPYADKLFDVVLMVSCISYFLDLSLAMHEANRVLKNGGCLVVGFIDKNSETGKLYEVKRQTSHFYKYSTYYTPQEIKSILQQNGFGNFKAVQTLFRLPDEITATEPVEDSYGRGSFVVINAIKNKDAAKETTAE